MFERYGSLRLRVGGCRAFVALDCIGTAPFFPGYATQHIPCPRVVRACIEQLRSLGQTIGIEKSLDSISIHNIQFQKSCQRLHPKQDRKVCLPYQPTANIHFLE